MTARAVAGSKRKLSTDQRLLLGALGVMVALVVLVALLSPRAEQDTRPSTYNSGQQGIKGAFLALERLGVKTERWSEPLNKLSELDAPHTTLVLAEPEYNGTDRKALRDEIEAFLKRGGRVLATGSSGAELLPFGDTKEASTFRNGLCTTSPEGPGPLAGAGSVEMAEATQWSATGPLFRVEQRCGNDAVVVRYPIGSGEAIWWSTASPMDNRELRNDADLRLMLTSLGAHRAVLFDEALHGEIASPWDLTRDLPIGWLSLQALLLFLLLLFSFSRRRGPIRMPLELPRTSPLEFAQSMGTLYAKANATTVPIEAARRELVHTLRREIGISAVTLDAGGAAIAQEITARFGGDWSTLAADLDASERVAADLNLGSALRLVQALRDDQAALRALLRRGQRTLTKDSQSAAPAALHTTKGDA